jgi:hypothetical protein
MLSNVCCLGKIIMPLLYCMYRYRIIVVLKESPKNNIVKL